MHNTYISSTLYAVQCKESFSLSFNGYSNFLYERFDRSPSYCSSCCGCCDCCSFSTYRVPIKPSLINGLRQSALLQLSASRKLILGGGDHYFCRLPAYGLRRGYYELNCSANESTVCNNSRRRIKGRCIRAASQKGTEISNSYGSDDAEAVLSFLSEEADKDVICSKCKNVTSSKRVETDNNKKKVSRERHLSLSEKVEREKKGSFKQQESSTKNLRREYEKSKKEREPFQKSENHRKRRDVSSGSSYYSFSSGDFGSDLEVQDEVDLEESSLRCKKDVASCVEGQLKEKFNRQENDSKKLQDVSNKERITFGMDIDWNLRNKSEKKLTEGTLLQTESTSEQQDMHSREFRTHESGCQKASISQKRVNSEKNKSSFVEDLDKKTNKAYIQTVNRRKREYIDAVESGADEVETNLLSQKDFSGREGNLEISEILLKEANDEHKKIVGSSTTTGKETLKLKKTLSGREENLAISEILLQEENDRHKNFIGSTSSGKDVINRSSQKYTGTLKIEDTNKTSNTRMKDMGVKEVSVLSSVQGVEGHQHQKGEKIITQAKEERRKKSEQFSEVSEAHEINVKDTSIIKSRARIQNWEEKSNISSDARVKWLQPDKRTTQSFQHGKGSELVSTLSEGYASDEKQVSNSQETSEVRFIPKSKSTSVLRTRESSCQTDERIANFELVRGDQKSGNLSISDETASREELSSQGSLNLVSEAGQYVILAAGDEGSSGTMLIPSSSQLGGGSAHAKLNTGIASPEIFLETSESGSSALYDNSGRSSALHLDALGSADRSEKSSRQFVDEFIERVRHEVTTSETQEIEVTGTKLPLKVGGNQIYSSRQQGVQKDSQSKEHNSSRSAGFPGTKGPSDEMWDVAEPSVEQGLVAKEPEIGKESGKSIVNRTGRSLWSMIADIVRLRWGSRAGSSSSAGKSGERNSSNKSDSETWFSGQEHEETSKSNVIKETSVLPQATTSDKLKLGKHYTESEGEVSNITKLKDKGKHLEVGSSSPNTLESVSTSVGASNASGEENVSWTEDKKDLNITTSGIQNMELPIPLLSSRPPIVEEIVDIGGSDVSGTESLVPTKAPVVNIAPVPSELSGSERKDGGLKQRKFQRNSQILRDRFADWEEAYKLELEQRRMDEMFMKEALLEAKKAADTWEVPVGAVLVQNGKIIARGCNLVEELRDSTAHAEMICIREASKVLRTWRLSDTTLYVTLEPCPMCAGAILQARIDTLVWGAPNKLLGADGSWIRLFPDGGETISESRDMPPAPVHPFHPKMKIRRGVLATECADAMQQFFQLRRKRKKEEPPKDPSCLPVTHHHPSKLLNKLHDVFHIMFCL